MKCSEVQDQLSAYFDGELSLESEAAIAAHLSDCSACSQELAAFDKLSGLAAGLENLPAPEGMWEQLEDQLDREDDIQILPTLPPIRQPQFSRRLFAIAAILTVGVGLSWFVYHQWFSYDEHDHLAINFEHYLEEFEENPVEAQQILLTKYEGRPTTVENATQVLQYEPIIAKGLPSGCSLENVYLLNMPCCQCAQAVCKCNNDAHIAIFEHNLDQPVWFGDRPTVNCLCHGKQTSVVQVNSRLAATWNAGDRFITIIGARDLEEVTRFVAFFSEPKSNG